MTTGNPTPQQAITGGEFLIRDVSADDIFTPEEWTEEHRMMLQTGLDFVAQRIIPNLERIEALEEGLTPKLLEEVGELGLLGSSVPEELEGLGLDFKSTMLITESMGGAHSFAVSFSAHTGIGTLPILYYGNDAQKKKYIPGLATGRLKGCYCLTEPGSGSDANSGKTTAKLNEAGTHYVLNGQKMWITNGGFADVLIVFAKIDDDDNLSAFILEKGYDGITMNPEEKKMGIKGSSTRQIFFNDVQVPVENLLYERGKGFKIAVNILNIGRIKLGGVVIGSCKDAITESVKYANAREQFGRPISKYGAIRHKLGEMAIQTYALETAVYRATQNIDDAIADLAAGGMDKGEATLKGIAAFAPECAMMKILGSEVTDYVVDEAVQIHGGMGYSAETRAEHAYRDARINRIFEGTNEINRMLTVDMILKKAMKGELDLMTPAMAVANELTGIPEFGNAPSGHLRKAPGLRQELQEGDLDGGRFSGPKTDDVPRQRAGNPHGHRGHGRVGVHRGKPGASRAENRRQARRRGCRLAHGHDADLPRVGRGQNQLRRQRSADGLRRRRRIEDDAHGHEAVHESGSVQHQGSPAPRGPSHDRQRHLQLLRPR